MAFSCKKNYKTLLRIGFKNKVLTFACSHRFTVGFIYVVTFSFVLTAIFLGSTVYIRAQSFPGFPQECTDVGITDPAACDEFMQGQFQQSPFDSIRIDIYSTNR